MEDLTNSIKSKLWEYKQTPFMSSFFVSFLFFNKEYLMIYFTDISYIEKKMIILDSIGIELFRPLYVGLFFVFIYPLIFSIFYYVTLFMSEYQNKIKQSIQKKRLLSVGESLEIIQENIKYKKELEDLQIKLNNKENELSTKEENLISQYDEYRITHEQEMEGLSNTNSTKISGLESELDLTKRKLSECEESRSEVGVGLPNEVVSTLNNQEQNIIETDNFEKDIMKVFHEIKSNFTKSELTRTLKDNYNFKQGKIDLYLSRLMKKGIIQSDTRGYSLTHIGLEMVNEMFE